MKNYLYILCAFLLAFAGCTKDADVEPIAPAPDGNTQVVLTGFSGRGTRTGFGGAEDGAVPFLWSAGDYIWARNTRSEAIAEGGSQATFVFESLETADTYDVFYNLTGPAAATALIPAEQTQQAAGELNLGQNGDFGYATAQNGTFTLEHATSYVWFDTYSSDVTSNLLSITLSVSGGQTIAGEAAFADGKLGDCKGSSSVTLSFGEEGVALPSQSNDTDVFAAMVLYPTPRTGHGLPPPIFRRQRFRSSINSPTVRFICKPNQAKRLPQATRCASRHRSPSPTAKAPAHSS